MSNRNAGVSRRGFLAGAAGGAAVATAGTAAGQETTTGQGTDAGTATGTAEGEERPDFGGYLDDVGNFTGIEDLRGEDEVTVEVGAQGNGGAFAFAPPAIHVDPGTTVVWEWTGEGGQHNVVHEGGDFESELVGDAGTTFEYTFDEDGVYNYYCQPHKALGMKAAVVVGSDYPTTTDPLPGQDSTETPTEGGGGEGDGESGGGGGGEPDFGGYLSDANNYDGVVDATGQDEVTVDVGAGDTGLAFGPAAVHVDAGATVVWEWTGEGGAHNVVAEDADFESGSPVGQAGNTYEYTFEEDGVYNYYCQPHKGSGMLGSVVVGTDYPTVGGDSGGGGGGGGGPSFPDSALSIGVATSFVMSATLGLAYFFMKYGGDYETPQ
ncbi:halocyanin domain-containing protein [Halorientalis litorea]|uniref:halocyanin domain-containing protein n=1 Tax=Halorientalis litorea TaxID=2931977 RepID=UPI001FF3DD99|nr:halocyanin domain-containing protein [Halorientalis litorea]